VAAEQTLGYAIIQLFIERRFLHTIDNNVSENTIKEKGN